MRRSKSKGPTPTKSKRRQQNKAIFNHEERITLLEKTLVHQMNIITRQATVIAEAVYGIQLLLQKGIITRDELLEIKETLIHADSILSKGGSVQPENTGSDVNSGGPDESGLPGS